MRVFFVMLLLTMFASTSLASNPPAPTPSEHSEKPKGNTEKQEKKSESTNQISQKTPVSTETTLPPLLSQKQTKNKPKNHNWYSLPEWWIVFFTGFLTLVTAALAWYTSRLYKATVALSEDAKKTFERQSNLERPWLFMEKVRVERREGAPIQPQIPNNWYISFIWRNIGRSPALIEGCAFKIEDTSTLQEPPDYSNASELTCPSSVAAGVEFETSKVGPAPEKGIKNGKSINLTIYGRLTYKELNGQLHHTGFAMDVSPHLPAANTSKCKNYEYYN